ncbi:MAG: VCBS repeat-containing protein, partial [Candidatus Coatesbacteria bacterium]
GRIYVVTALAVAAAAPTAGLTEKAGFPVTVDLDKARPVESSPSLGDVNGDGRDEIVLGCKDGKVYVFNGQGNVLPGWPVTTGDTIVGSPAIGDIDGDKRDEIIIGSDDGNIYALEGNGVAVPGWPVATTSTVRSTPAVADLDGDMRDDVIVGSSDGKVYALSGRGSALIGWPVRVGGAVESSPAVADVDGDDLPEVAVGADDGNVYLIDNDGKIVPGWPVETRYYVRSSPAIGDIDNDGSLEIVVGSDDFNVYAWNANGTLVPGWPVATEYKISVASPALADLDGDKKLDVIVGSGDNLLYAWDGSGSPLSGWPVQTYGRLYNSSPCVADLNGDGQLDIVVGAEDVNLYAFDSSGRPTEGSPIMLMGPVHSSPAVGDVDGDGLLELAVADNASALHCFDLRGSAALGRGARWSEFHQSHWKAGVYGYVGGASQLPKCVVPKMEGEYAGDVSIEYNLSDPQLDTLDIKILYSDDWGHTWHEATVAGMTEGLGPHRYQGVIVWDSRADLKGPLEKEGERDADVLADEWREYREQKDVKVKIIPVDMNGFGTAGETTLLHVDNNIPPAVTLKPITEEVAKDVYFDYEIRDPEHDLVGLKAEYSLDGGATWNEATVDGAVADIRASRYEGSLTWESDKNVEGLDQDDVMFRLTPNDNDPGEIGEISELHVDNNDIPQVAVSDIEEEVGGDVAISYELSDTESDLLALQLHYSLDGGQTWKEATVTGPTAGIASATYDGTITWNSRADTLGVDRTSVQFRVTPLDNDEGKADATGSFHLDNNDTPTLTITPPTGEQAGPVEIFFDISDPEGDDVTLLPEYFDEIDQKWKIATVTGTLSDLPPAKYAGTFVWDSYVDMLGLDNTAVQYRITAFDNDQGEPVVSAPFHVDDNSAPAVLVNDITTEQEQDVVVMYTLSDLERDTLSFRVEFSEDGGATWKPASVSGPDAGLGVEDYVGEITWHSARDTMNKHLSQARVR